MIMLIFVYIYTLEYNYVLTLIGWVGGNCTLWYLSLFILATSPVFSTLFVLMWLPLKRRTSIDRFGAPLLGSLPFYFYFRAYSSILLNINPILGLIYLSLGTLSVVKRSTSIVDSVWRCTSVEFFPYLAHQF